MQFIPYTILGLFDSSQKTYEIPVYQRAYSWEKQNWKTFLDDLLEQIQGKNNYFFGNVLLETIQKNKKYEIIDGQQRLTTITIFIRAILNEIKQRFSNDFLDDFGYEDKVKIYLKSGGNIKLRPVEYDRACYDTLIVDNKDKFPISTPSQQRIKDAKEYFQKELKSYTPETLLSLIEKIENTELTAIELEGKKDSALMFELENNRGKELTNMEKLKSYFMYQMYVYSAPEEIESNVEGISNIFKNIYLIINDLKKINEDSVLIYHNNAYIKGYYYRNLEDVKEIFKKSDDKVEWIKNYIQKLYTTFSHIKQFEHSSDPFANRLNAMDIPAFIYPFIIKGYEFHASDHKKLNQLFHLLEILTFREKLINSRADIQDRLNHILLWFNGDLSKLLNEVKDKLNATWYWSDQNTLNYLNGSLYGHKHLKYILWQYEDFIQNKGYGVIKIAIDRAEIEHISPQSPTNGDPIQTGYDVDANNKYSEEFTNNYLNCLGNLMLISKSHNCSIGNQPFQEKLTSYKSNPLLNQQAEIEKFVDIEHSNSVWKTNSIKKRHQKIVEFASKNWSFDSIIL